MQSLSPEDTFHKNLISENETTENLYMPKRIAKPNNTNTKQIMHNLDDTSNFTKCKILLKDASKLNKTIIDFFKENLQVLNMSKFMFEWIPVYKEEVEFYDEQGIDKFPVMIINNDNHITGISNILDILENIVNKNQNILQNNKQEYKPKRQEPSEELKDYFMDELNAKGNDDDDDDDDNDKSFSKTVQDRLRNMNSARKKGGLHTLDSTSESVDNSNKDVFGKSQKKSNHTNQSSITTNKSTIGSIDPIDIIKQISTKSGEDDMMNKYWENQEETEL